MKKGLILFAAILGMFLMSVTGYSKDNSLEKILKKGELVIGLDDTFAPMGFRDEKGEIVGFDIDLAREVGKRLGVEVKFLPCDWDGIILSLNSKKIDVVWNGMTITEKRKEQIIFSEPYFQGEQIIVTTGDSKLEKLQDLKGKTIGLQSGSTSYFAIEKSPIFKELKGIKYYPENVSALMDLKAGRIDGVVLDSMVGNYYVTKENNKSGKILYKTLVESLGTEGFGTGVGIRKEDLSLKEAIDRELENMRQDGSFEAIYKKWFGGK